MFGFFFFFFSSRRRHTRYWRDWSSDVCSSDLSQSVRLPDRFDRRPFSTIDQSGRLFQSGDYDSAGPGCRLSDPDLDVCAGAGWLDHAAVDPAFLADLDGYDYGAGDDPDADAGCRQYDGVCRAHGFAL